MRSAPLDHLRHHVSGAVARGEREAIVEAPAAHILETLRVARDEAQTRYARTRQRCVTGHATQREMDAARAAYMLAQSEYRDALIRAKAAGGAA